MIRAARGAPVKCAPLGLVALMAACGDGRPCDALTPSPPMTEARARDIAPAISEGLALSTTHVYGDCRSTQTGGLCPGARCVRARAPLRVLAIAANRSVPRAAACEGGYVVEDLAARASADASSTEAGEVVLELEAGLYSVYLSWDDHCAFCGIEGGDALCLIEVAEGRLAARDLVLDRSAR